MTTFTTTTPIARRAAGIAAVLVAVLGVAGFGAGSAAALTAPDTTTLLTLSTNTPIAGQIVTLTATVTGVGGAPPGTILFEQNANGTQTQLGSPVPLTPSSDGSAAATASLQTSLTAGTYTVTATYRADPTQVLNFSTSDSNAVLVTVSSNQSAVLNTVVTLAVSIPDPAAPSVQTLTATVTQQPVGGTPTGTVLFYSNGVLLGGATLSSAGVATLPSVAFVPGGTYVLTASYLGDLFDKPSAAGAVTVAVAGGNTDVHTTTTASAAPSRITAGIPIVLTAHVVQTGAVTLPTGNLVFFYANGVLLGQSPVDTATGIATLRVDGWVEGTYAITVSYIGDIDHHILASAASFDLSVGPPIVGPPPTLTVTVPPLSSTYGGTVPALTPTYTGFVAGDTVASLLSPAVCTTTVTSATVPGTYPVTCTGAADPNYTIAYTAGSITVTQAPLTVTAANATMVSGQAVPTFTTTITGFVNGETQATVPVTGAVACTTTATTSSPAGTYPITCTQGTLTAANYSFTFVAGTLTVTAASPSVVCTGGKRSDNGHDWDWWHDQNHGSHCESLLADPSSDQNAAVNAGQKLTIVYSDENQIGAGANAPTAVLSNGQVLPITVTSTSHQPLHYVDNNGGSPSNRYQSLLTFKLPANLAAGQYSILVTAYDSTGNLDQWIWQIKVGKPSGHDDDNNDADWQSIFSRLLLGRGWIHR